MPNQSLLVTILAILIAICMFNGIGVFVRWIRRRSPGRTGLHFGLLIMVMAVMFLFPDRAYLVIMIFGIPIFLIGAANSLLVL